MQYNIKKLILIKLNNTTPIIVELIILLEKLIQNSFFTYCVFFHSKNQIMNMISDINNDQVYTKELF